MIAAPQEAALVVGVEADLEVGHEAAELQITNPMAPLTLLTPPLVDRWTVPALSPANIPGL